jgi:hypothetical protein
VPAGHSAAHDDVELQDEHVEVVELQDELEAKAASE